MPVTPEPNQSPANLEQPEMAAGSVLQVLDLLEAASVEVWIDGGWGVDALLGEQTRLHADLDVIVRSSELPQLRKALLAMGSAVKPAGTAANIVLVDPLGREVDVHVITFDDRGYGIFQLPDGRRWPFPPAAFRGRGQIAGREVRCLSAEAQVQCHAQGYVPTERDLRDMELLQARFGVVLPLQLCRKESS